MYLYTELTHYINVDVMRGTRRKQILALTRDSEMMKKVAVVILRVKMVSEFET